MPPDDEELSPEDEADGQGSWDPSKQSSHTEAVYPIRQMMELIENIADKQTAISRHDWPVWCARLEQCLSQVEGSAVLDRFKELKLNPLSPLWQGPFRPPYAEENSSEDGRNYEEILCRIERAWNVVSLEGIGVSVEA